jgi:redox-sensitive bicupin YhaK (pirin superfamily)
MTDPEPRPAVGVLGADPPCAGLEVLEPRAVPLGGLRAMTVHRTLPQRRRSLVGSWCFLDHYGPDDVAATGGMSVARHPHTGLATVSWLFSGQIEHLDSGGNAATVRPGELNLMIAGRGITHQELSDPATTTLHGVQLWYALPESTRHSANGFVHQVPEPVVGDGFTARVFLGSLLGSTSPVETRTPDLLGAELVLEPGATARLPVRVDCEHAVLAEDGPVRVAGHEVAHRALAYLPPGAEELVVTAGAGRARVLLLGGVPLGEQIVMWWNFVGRSHEEVATYRRRYQAELGFEPADPDDIGPALFGEFPTGQPAPLPAPPLPGSRLLPRQ